MAGAERLPRRADLPGPGSRVHLMGVGGAGMRGLAVLLAGGGYRVSGCDRSEVTEPGDLRDHGVEVLGDHDPEHARGCALLVRSSAVPADHAEVEAARAAGVPVLKRGRALGAMVNERRLVAVAGTHGKTTLTAMATLACRAAGLDPVAAVGGRVPEWSGYALPGEGGVAVVEADEYDRSFLELDPSLLVLTSLEPEHLESYGSFEEVKAAYRELAERAAGRDGLLFCSDDSGARGLAEGIAGAAGYGFSGDPYRLERLEAGAPGAPGYRLRSPGSEVRFGLALPGTHNAQNAAGALAVALTLGADPRRLERALEDFGGVARRLEALLEEDRVVVVDDYAHHPTEVAASLSALRERYPERRLVVVFQPHLFSRTRDFAADFATALSRADLALVLPIYPAREEPIPGVTAELLVEAAEGGADRLRLASEDEVSDAGRVREMAREGPLVLAYMGAGDVTEIAREVTKELEEELEEELEA